MKCHPLKRLLKLKGLRPDFLPLLTKAADGIAPFNFGTVIFILLHVFFYDILKFFHPVPVPVQLALHSVEKPFFHQSLFVTAVGK